MSFEITMEKVQRAASSFGVDENPRHLPTSNIISHVSHKLIKMTEYFYYQLCLSTNMFDVSNTLFNIQYCKHFSYSRTVFAVH